MQEQRTPHARQQQTRRLKQPGSLVGQPLPVATVEQPAVATPQVEGDTSLTDDGMQGDSLGTQSSGPTLSQVATAVERRRTASRAGEDAQAVHSSGKSKSRSPVPGAKSAKEARAPHAAASGGVRAAEEDAQAVAEQAGRGRSPATRVEDEWIKILAPPGIAGRRYCRRTRS